jgi:iron complex transport system permease protein
MPPCLAPRTPAALVALLLGLALAGAAAVALALAIGSVRLPAAAVLQALIGHAHQPDLAIVRELRLPRATAAFATGGLLGIAGALMQILLRNPLADPYVLGLSGGAAAGALGAFALGHPALSAPGALAGSLLSTLLVFGLARSARERRPWSATRLLLTGIVVASGWGALIALLLTLAPESQLRGMLFWLIGDLSAAGPALPAVVTLVVVTLAATAMARDLNVLIRGEETAVTLGVPIERVTLALFGLAALATTAAVTTGGAIGFVGLVVPHALRLVIGNDQRALLPASALGGGVLLTVADTVARSVVAPVQLPVGVVTALLGVPAFLWLLHRQ